nr:MAG TPA: hypothetical protein [Microviridae sp.]
MTRYKVGNNTFNTYEEALKYTQTIWGGSGASMIETINEDSKPLDTSSSDSDINSFLDTLFEQAQNGSERDRAAGRNFSENEVQEARMNWMMQQNQRDYEQELYDQRYSFQGQISQMQQSGLNPALMYGGVGTTASQGGAVNQSAEGPSHDTTASPTDRLNSFISLFSQLFGIGTDIADKINTIKSGKSQRDLNAKEGALTDAQTATEGARKDNVEADTANKEANTNYIKNKQILESLMGVLERKFKRGQISEQYWKIQSAALDYAFASESYEDRLETIVLQNNNLRATNDLIKAQEAGEWSKVSLNKATEDLTKANKELTDYLITQEGLDTEVREYAQMYNLPPDQPAVIMMHQNLNDALAKAQIDSASPDPEVRREGQKAVKTLTEAMVKIREACMKSAQGKMTDAEKTQFWAKTVQGVLGEAVKGAAIYFGAKGAGKVAGAAAGSASKGKSYSLTPGLYSKGTGTSSDWTSTLN